MASIRLLFLSFALIMIIVTTSARPMNSGNFLRQRRGLRSYEQLSDMIREVNEPNRQKRSRGNMVLSIDYLLKALEKAQREQTAESQRGLMDTVGRR